MENHDAALHRSALEFIGGDPIDSAGQQGRDDPQGGGPGATVQEQLRAVCDEGFSTLRCNAQGWLDELERRLVLRETAAFDAVHNPLTGPRCFAMKPDPPRMPRYGLK